jgi:hypothetical protein
MAVAQQFIFNDIAVAGFIIYYGNFYRHVFN